MPDNLLGGSDTGGTPPFIDPRQAGPQQQPQQQQPDPIAMQNAAMRNNDIQQHYGIGRAFRSLLGDQTNYQIDPQTGQMNAVPVKRSPGQLMRGILAGALLGASAGAEDNTGSFAKGAARGVGASLEYQDAQDKQRQLAAQQQFQRQLQLKEEQRKDTREAREKSLNDAQIAYHNAATLRENQLLQNSNYEFHEKVAANGRTQLQPFFDAGVNAQFKDTPESSMQEIIKNNPAAAHLLWEPTGTRIKIGGDGKPTVEALYSAVDPKGKVKVTDAQLKQWKEDGLDQFYGKSFFDVLKKDKELDASQYMSLNQKDQELVNKKLKRDRDDLELQKTKSQISLEKAQIFHLNAETAKAYSDISDKKDFDEAWSILTTGGDIAKLTAKQRAALTKGITEVQGSIERQIHELPKGPDGQSPSDQERAKNLYGTWDQFQGIQNKLYGVKPSPEPAKNIKTDETSANFLEVMQTQGVKSGTPESYEYIQKSNLPPGKKLEMVKSTNSPIPFGIVSQLASEENKTPDKKVKELQAQGFTVAENPWKQMVTNPELKK